MLHSMQLSKQKNIVFSVPNLETQADIKTIKSALERVPGVHSVGCDKINKRVTVYHNTERYGISDFIDSISVALERKKFTENTVLSKSDEPNEEAEVKVHLTQTVPKKVNRK